METSLEQAIAHHNAGRLQEAGEMYRSILQNDPRHAVANHNLGMLAIQMDQPAAGLPYLETALDVDPARPQFWLSYIDALDRAGQSDEARAILALARQQGLEGAETDALESRLNDPAQAESSGADAQPDAQDVAQLTTLLHQGRFTEAEPLAQSVTQRFPRCGIAWLTLGAAYHAHGHNADALTALNKAITFLPNDAHGYYFLGNVLGALGHLSEAETAYRHATKLHPEFVEAHHNLGSTLKDLRRLEEAEASYRRTIELNPHVPDAWRNLAYTLKDLGKFAEAAACCRHGLEIAPHDATLHQAMANQLAHLSDYDDVVKESDAAFRLTPNDRQLWEQRLYTFSYHPDLTAEQIFAEFVRWGDRFPVPVTDFSAHDRTPGRRLRVGFVSPDFRKHTSRFYFWPTFAHHDHAAVEMFAYSNVLNEDDATQKFKPLFDHWRNIRGVQDQDVARMVREDRIDILVDGCNHMLDDRLGVFALKPAPIQVTWLGAAWTTGLKQVDYVLFDPYIAPEGTLARETIVRLPRCFIAYQPENDTPVAPTPALKNRYITFGYSGRSERLNHHTFRVWGEILRQIPNARLILDFRCFADPPTQQHFREFMGKYGMDLERVIMRHSTNIFEGLNDFDVLLDCFPHSGGTMLLDALWMGVPCLTLAGRPPLGRIGTTFMTNLGMTEWIATSHDDYIKKAVELTRDIPALAAIRAGLRERMLLSPVMDGKGFARDVEKAYQWMYEHWIHHQAVGAVSLRKSRRPSTTVSAAARRLFEQAVALKNTGRFEQAVAMYRQVLKIDPDLGPAHYNLGNTLAELGQFEAAEENLRQAVQNSPGNALAYNNLGVVLHKLHRYEASENWLQQALKMDRDYIDAHFNLGNTLRSLERFEEAQQCYERALALRPDDEDALIGFAALLHQQGQYPAAFDKTSQALRIRQSVDAKNLFIACVRNLQFTHVDAELRDWLVRALTEPWGRPAEIMKTVLGILKLDAVRSTPLEVSTNPLLLAALASAPVCDVETERSLTAVRLELLNRVSASSPLDGSLVFLGALACQCFINEYVFVCSDNETRQVQELRNRVEHALASGAPLPEPWLLVLATYIPLHALTQSHRIPERPWSIPVAHVVTQQILEPAEEQRLRATLPQLTPIADTVSLEVQQQYEENPYPRWIKSARPGEARALTDFLQEKFPLVVIEKVNNTDTCEILVAGCGTGQHPIASAQRIAGAKILAVDLSRSSLSYARRKAAEMAVDSIEFAQADLLQLGAAGRAFDAIESVGVLHHLADPWKGWRALLALLRPGGFMKLGFYSALARRDVVRIRDQIAARGYPATPNGIRACRQELMRQGDGGQFQTILSSPDFFSTSACRDLLFHVQEHRMTLDQIRAFLREQHLRFLGFELESHDLQAYRARFPTDHAATNLDQWTLFEEERPRMFGNMYQFWIQKTRPG